MRYTSGAASNMIQENRHKHFLGILPLVTTIPNGREVIINFMTSEQISETFLMIKDAAENGDGFGVDEYPTEEQFRQDLEDGDCFGIVCKESGTLLAAFILAISKFYRGSPSVVDPFIVVKKSERHNHIGEYCMRKVEDFSKRLGYIGLYVDTFCDNHAMIRILSKIGGYTRVGYLPAGGRVPSGRMVSSWVYYKELTGD